MEIKENTDLSVCVLHNNSVGWQDVLHREDVHLMVEGKRHLELCANNEGAVDLNQLADLAAYRDDALE